MRLFPIHIYIKDCSYLLFYFAILRFNLTGETYLPDMARYFPAAPNLTISEVLAASLFYNIIPLLVSFVTYFFIYFGVQKLFSKTTNLSLLLTGFVLTLTTPIVYILLGGFNPFTNKASGLALVLWFIASIATYYWFNKRDVEKVLNVT